MRPGWLWLYFSDMNTVQYLGITTVLLQVVVIYGKVVFVVKEYERNNLILSCDVALVLCFKYSLHVPKRCLREFYTAQQVSGVIAL